MPRKTFVTITPNRTGAFLVSAKIIAKHQGNIVRVSYNKAVDLHTLFIDVEASEEALKCIGHELDEIGYLSGKLPEINVVMIEIRIPDKAGALIPVLEILNRFEINISYINSIEESGDYQDFAMGLLMDNPGLINRLLNQIGEMYPVKVTGYSGPGNCPDNSIFYLNLANEAKESLQLPQDQLLEFISEANRVLQMLQRTNENPVTVFEHIRKFLHFVSSHQGDRFQYRLRTLHLTQKVTLHAIEPVCGSNTYILKTDEEIVLIDSGYALYYPEMKKVLHALCPDWDACKKRLYITHADVDHCGLLSHLEQEATLVLNQKSADSIRRQQLGIRDYRELQAFCFGYSKLSRMISGYIPPKLTQAVIYGEDAPQEHGELLPIGELSIGDVQFDILEGSGGHVYGEEIFVSRKLGVLFTGDNFLNVKGFTSELQSFHAIAPYLMRSVNVDSRKASKMRKDIQAMAENLAGERGSPCLICGGHGALSLYDVQGFQALPENMEKWIS